MQVIGFLGNASPARLHLLSPRSTGLSETRDVLGQNLATEYRWAEGLRHGGMFLIYLAARGSDQD